MNLGVIPARLASTRFPGKMLAPLAGKPLVMHTYEQVRQAELLDEVIIAVDDEQVQAVLEKLGAQVQLTAVEHQSGTDRAAEVSAGSDAAVVINIQGDEPLIDPRLIDDLLGVFTNQQVVMATAAGRNLDTADLLDSNVVKVFLNFDQTAVDFQRLVPDNLIGGCYRHIGIYAYRRDFLHTFTQLPPSENERHRRLEQMRALDNGFPVHCLLTDYRLLGVDTPEDLELVRSRLDTKPDAITVERDDHK